MDGKLSVNLLLRANFSRLWRSGAFWVSEAVMFACGVFEVAISYPLRQQPGILDNRYMIFVLLSGVVLSAFCSLFTGEEYSCGTIRNKLAAGHSRASVYLASLAVCAGAGVLACLAYILAMLALGLPLLGAFNGSIPALAWFTLCSLVMTTSLCAIFTMIAMLNQNKAAVAVACIFLAYFLLFLGIYLNSRLSEAAVIPAREYIENGRILVQEASENPAYVQGVKRAIFQLLYDLPGCQAVQLLATAEACPLRLPLVSLGTIALSTCAGLALFQRKDLK